MRRLAVVVALLTVLIPAVPATAKKPASAPLLYVADSVRVGQHPEGVDVDPDLGLAVTANRNGQSASLVDLTTGRMVAEVPVDRHPVAVAVNPVTHQAVVANASAGTLTVIDLVLRRAVRTIPVGLQPSAVAIHAGQNRAVVANPNASTASIVDLATGAIVTTLPVGRHPSGVAVNAGLGASGLAAVTSELGDTVTFIDLAPLPVVTEIVVLDADGRPDGRCGDPDDAGDKDCDANLAPAGIAWDLATNTLAVANAGGWSVTLLALNAAGAVTGRAVVPVGKRPQGIDAADGFALVTSDQDDAFLLDLVSGTVAGRVRVGKHPRGVAIDPVRCRAVVTNRTDNTVSFLGVPCRVLRLTAVQPDSASVGSGPLTVVLRGTGFLPGSVVNFGDYRPPLVPSVITASAITVTVPAAFLAVPGTFAVSVQTPTPETSSSLPFVVNVVPPPALTLLLPAVGVANFQDVLLTVSGQHFLPGAVIWFDGEPVATVVDSATQAHAVIPGSFMGYGRTVPVRIVNPGDVASNTLAHLIVNPLPILSEVTPTNVVRDSVDTEIVLFSGVGDQGTFVLNSQVYFCRSDSAALTSQDCVQIPSVPLRPNPPVQINAVIPPALLAEPGAYAIRVFNPPPGGGESWNQPFTVTTATPPPGYAVSVYPLRAGHPERVALAAPGLAAAALPGSGQIQLFDLAPGPGRGPTALLSLSWQSPIELLGDLDGDVANATLAVAVPFADRLDIVQLNPLDPAASVITRVALPVGSFPFGVAVNPATRQAVVANILGGSLSVVSLTTGMLVRTINLPGVQTPAFVAVNPTTNVAVVVDQGDFENPGRLFLVDVARGRVVDTVAVGVAPTYVAINPVTGHAVVANSLSDTISVVDTARRGSLVGTVAVGQEPVGVAIDPATNRAMVVNTQSNQVMLVDLATLSVSTVIQIGGGGAVAPSDLAWDTALGVAISSTASIGDLTNSLIVIDLP